MATTRIVMNLDGSIIDKVNGHIIANNQYAHKIQVISPFPSSDSVSLEWYLRNARITTYSQYIGLLKDDSGNPIMAGAIVDSSKEYYQTVKDWYVWQVAIDSQALSAISKYHAGKVSLTVKFKEFRNLYVEEAITLKGTFGSRKSTTAGDLPVTSTEGDYYVCDFLDYYSVITEEDYTLLDYVYYTNDTWLKGVAYMYRLNSSVVTLSVDPSVLGQDLESVSVSTGELLASQIAALESVILGELPEDYAAGLFVRKELDLNYSELSPLPTDQILIERDRYTYYTNLADIMLGVDEIESDIIRTHDAISATEGTGLYADDTDVVIGSATGDGISWNAIQGLFFRGKIQSGTIIDEDLLDELKGEQGESVWVKYSANSDGSAMTIGIEEDTEYMGMYIGIEVSTEYLDYTWSKFIAIDGTAGSDGGVGISFNYVGVLTYLSDLSFIVDPTTNDAYRITETNELWIWSGTEWKNMGVIKGDTGATGATGATGPTGPGLTFRGTWEADTNYYYDLVRHDIVEYPADSQTYYYVKVQGTLNESTFSTDDWTVMTSFAAVATDLLLAQDATILKGLVMGSADTTTEPFIRSYNKTSLSAGTGFYLEGIGKFNFGDTDTYIDWDGTNLTVKGDIEADSLTINEDLTVTKDIIIGTGGQIHSLNMDAIDDATGGVFIQADGQFIFGNPTAQHVSWDGDEFEIASSYVPFKVNSITVVGATEATVNVTVTNAWGGGSYLSVSAVPSGDADSWVATGNVYSSGSHTFDIATSYGDFGYGKIIDLKFRFGTTFLTPTTSKESDSQTIIMPTPVPHIPTYSSIAGWPETDLTSQFGGASKTPVSSTVFRIDLAIRFMLTDDITNGETITTIPSGYRPSALAIYGFLGNNPGTDYETDTAPYFKIDTSGVITIDDTLDTTEEPVTIMATYFI